MYQKPHNPNKAFLAGSALLAIAVIFIVILFVMLSLWMGSTRKHEIVYQDCYQIELKDGFIGESVSLYLNDSLLFNETVNTDTLRFRLNRFDDSNALLVVDNRTDNLTTFNLEEKGGRIILRKKGDVISMTTVDW